jgi:hypothetical protein
MEQVYREEKNLEEIQMILDHWVTISDMDALFRSKYIHRKIRQHEALKNKEALKKEKHD